MKVTELQVSKVYFLPPVKFQFYVGFSPLYPSYVLIIIYLNNKFNVTLRFNLLTYV